MPLTLCLILLVQRGRLYIYIYIYIYIFTNPFAWAGCVRQDQFLSRFEFRVCLLLDWLPNQGGQTQTILLFNHSWKDNIWIHTLTRCINTSWNQPLTGFEIVSPCPFPTTITYIYIYIYIYIYNVIQNQYDLFKALSLKRSGLYHWITYLLKVSVSFFVLYLYL